MDMNYAEIERRNRDLDSRSADIDRMFAELEKRSVTKTPEVEQSPAPQQVTYASDVAKEHIYSPAPDFMKPSSQAAADLARMQRDQKVFLDIALQQAEKVSPKSGDLAELQRMMLNNKQAFASPDGYFQPMPGQQVEFKADGTRVMRQAVQPAEVRDALPSTLPVPGIGPDFVDQGVVIMRDPDSGRGPNGVNVTVKDSGETRAPVFGPGIIDPEALDRRMTDLEGAMDGLVYQIRQLVQRLA